MPKVDLHNEYVKKLEEIGKSLGFDTKGVKTSLGTLDCIWRIKNKFPKIKENLPIIAFEVICSEAQKSLRGSFVNMLVARPSLAVFVLIEKGILQHANSLKNTSTEQWLERIKKFIEKIKQNFVGDLRIAIWNETDVDLLFRKKCL